jgi:ABC-2 type transport system ATP-binding protein
MISIQDLHFSYRKKKVFSGLTLELRPGYIYGLLGKNGTGKSTLLRGIAGLLFPDKGSIEVAGHVPGKRQPAFLQDVFMVPEEFYLPNVPLDFLLKHQARFYPSFSRSQFDNYVKEFDIPVDNTLQHMSYGQKKKALISFGLAANTSLLLLDEPTNGLDIMSKSQFRKVMAGALDEKKCIIISTHQVKDLENLIDRVTIIDDGSILFDQAIEQIAAKLSFRISNDANDIKNSLYNESSLKGSAIVARNVDGDESKIDLELLYKAIILNRQGVQSAFNA